MKKIKNLKSILSVALAVFATVNVMAFSRAGEPNFYQAWEIEDLGVFFNNDSSRLEQYDGVIFDFSKQESFNVYYKDKESNTWQLVAKDTYTILPEDEVSGTLKIQDIEYNYTLEPGRMTLTNGTRTFTLKPSSLSSDGGNREESQETQETQEEVQE